MIEKEILQIVASQTGDSAVESMDAELAVLADMGLDAHQIEELIRRIARHFHVELSTGPGIRCNYDTLTLRQIERSVEEELLLGNGLA